jgi:hypothetical protein
MDAIKVLGQIAAAATTAEALYTVPTLTQTTCSTLMIANRTAATVTFRVSLHVAGEGVTYDGAGAITGIVPVTKQHIFYDVPLDGNTSLTLTIGITLGSADVVSTYASATGLSFNLFGVETS